MGGIEASIAALSMNMAQVNVANQVSVRMMSKVLDTSKESAAALIDQIAAAPPPVATNEIGGLMDIMA